MPKLNTFCLFLRFYSGFGYCNRFSCCAHLQCVCAAFFAIRVLNAKPSRSKQIIELNCCRFIRADLKRPANEILFTRRIHDSFTLSIFFVRIRYINNKTPHIIPVFRIVGLKYCCKRHISLFPHSNCGVSNKRCIAQPMHN